MDKSIKISPNNGGEAKGRGGRYYLIVGEASGDLHASRLMRSLKKEDPKAEFRFFGGDLMTAEGGTRVRHFKEIAYMGFIPVLLHLRVILDARKQCKEDIIAWQPDVVILVDYAGFNLNIAQFLRKEQKKGSFSGKIFYYISPKIWAWKEGRIKNFKRDVDEMFCILPFEVDFFEKKHNYPVHYIGNPTANEVQEFQDSYKETAQEFFARNNISVSPVREAGGGVIALLAGSRMQEIKDNLPMMIECTRHLVNKYDIILAGAPSINKEVYDKYLEGTSIKLVMNQTYPLLSHATAALVTSGTATLETCCFNVPQVVLYKTPLPRVSRFVWDHFFKVKFISLVNLIADRVVVEEMMAEKFTAECITSELDAILPGGSKRDAMLMGYADVKKKLGDAVAPDNAANIISH